VLTVSVGPADHARAREVGADEAASKAADLDDVVATINRLGGG